jgi:hypothetical protein
MNDEFINGFFHRARFSTGSMTLSISFRGSFDKKLKKCNGDGTYYDQTCKPPMGVEF